MASHHSMDKTCKLYLLRDFDENLSWKHSHSRSHSHGHTCCRASTRVSALRHRLERCTADTDTIVKIAEMNNGSDRRASPADREIRHPRICRKTKFHVPHPRKCFCLVIHLDRIWLPVNVKAAVQILACTNGRRHRRAECSDCRDVGRRGNKSEA